MTEQHSTVFTEIFRNCNIQCLETIHHIHYEQTRVMEWNQRFYPSVVWLKTGTVLTSFQDKKESVLRTTGSVVYFPANMRKFSRHLTDHVEFAAVTLSADSSYGIDLFSCFEIPFMIQPPASDTIKESLTELLGIGVQPADAESFSLICKFRELAMRITGALLKNAPLKQAPDHRESLRILPVMKYIQQNYNRQITLDELARMVCLSRIQFYRIFKSVAEIPPGEFILRTRFREAEKLLISTDRTISEIAALTGWNDPFYFSRKFSEYYRQSPSDFRKNSSSFRNFS